MAVRTGLGRGPLGLLSLAILAVTAPEVWALITGATGNTPVADPGWPKGAAAVFNTPARIAWWEGPPFGGGQWHAECRGDAKALSAVLADFAKVEVKTKRLVLHDGVGNSFWLNPNDEPAQRAAAQMDWSFMVWQPATWQRLRQLPADLNPTEPEDAASGPPAQLDVYIGGQIKWADVIVPKGLTIDDRRLEAHGFTLADGSVLEGKVTDLATRKPLAAKVRLERIEPQPKGSYRYTTVRTTVADAQGHWVLKKAPAGWHRVILEAAGFVSRVIGYAKTDAQPRWQAFDGGLARPATIVGRVTDEAGRPLADVVVRFQDTTTPAGVRYESAQGPTVKTGADGRFRTDQLPVGRATLWVHKSGYCQHGLGQPMPTPKQDVELTMLPAGRIRVTVDFTGKARPNAYLVTMEPEGRDAVGKYGGSGHINAKNQILFDNVPPGRYVLRGQPNPSSGDQRTEPITVEVQGGKTAEIELRAK